MDFETLVREASGLLRRHERISYGGLKRRLDIDDDVLADLKTELIYARKIAADVDGRVLALVTGISDASPDDPGATPAEETERRHLTVLFCDLVGSTALSARLDPEDLQEVVRLYQVAASEVIARFEGTVAQFLGDGILAYFGYPTAHEDDGYRAVRAGMEIVESIKRAAVLVHKRFDVTLAVRVGIHTGLSVVGRMGGSGHYERLAVGETPNLAARLQSLADANAVLISEATMKLVAGSFDCAQLPAQTIKGIDEPLGIYRVERHRGQKSRLDLGRIQGLTPLVDREAERARLRAHWETLGVGHGAFVLIRGEAGAGKSRLADYLVEHTSPDDARVLECRCSPLYRNTALHPVASMLEKAIGVELDVSEEENLCKLELALNDAGLDDRRALPLLTPILGCPLPDASDQVSATPPQKLREQALLLIKDLIAGWAKRSPVILVVEDLQWADPSTLEWLDLLLSQRQQDRPLLGLFTCRPEFAYEWTAGEVLEELSLGPLPAPYREVLINEVAGEVRLPSQLLRQLAEKTGGNPLFAEELTRMLVETGRLQEAANDEMPEAVLSIPDNLRASLMARLDNLGSAKSFAQLGSVVGRSFSIELLRDLADCPEETLATGVSDLVRAGLLRRRHTPGGEYLVFKHALICDAAYESLTRKNRRKHHAQVAKALQGGVMRGAASEILAYHLAQAGQWEAAIAAYQTAGLVASGRSHNLEAINHFRTALDLLESHLPESAQRDAVELGLQLYLGVPLMAIKGYGDPQVGAAFERARALCDKLGAFPQLGTVLIGLASYYLVRADYATARELVDQLAALAEGLDDESMTLRACFGRGAVLFWAGRFDEARRLLQKAIEIYNPAKHAGIAMEVGHDAGVIAYTHTAMVLWHMGKPTAARDAALQAVETGKRVGHAHSHVCALAYAAILSYMCGDAEATLAWAEQTIELAREQDFPLWLADAQILKGWALAEAGDAERGRRLIENGLALFRATGALLWRPEQLTIYAGVLLKQGETTRADRVLDEAMELAESNATDYLQAELYRLRGDRAERTPGEGIDEARFWYQKSMVTARARDQSMIEMRAICCYLAAEERNAAAKPVLERLEELTRAFGNEANCPDLVIALRLLAGGRGNATGSHRRKDATEPRC